MIYKLTHAVLGQETFTTAYDRGVDAVDRAHQLHEDENRPGTVMTSVDRGGSCILIMRKVNWGKSGDLTAPKQ